MNVVVEGGRVTRSRPEKVVYQKKRLSLRPSNVNLWPHETVLVIYLAKPPVLCARSMALTSTDDSSAVPSPVGSRCWTMRTSPNWQSRFRGRSGELGGGAADAELSGRHGVGTTTKNDAWGSTSSYSATVRLLVLCLLARTDCFELPGPRVLPCSTKGPRRANVRRRGSLTDT